MAPLFSEKFSLTLFVVYLVMSGSNNEHDREPRLHKKEQVVSVSELKVIISQMLKETLKEQSPQLGINQDRENHKGRAMRLSLSHLVAKTTGPLVKRERPPNLCN